MAGQNGDGLRRPLGGGVAIEAVFVCLNHAIAGEDLVEVKPAQRVGVEVSHLETAQLDGQRLLIGSDGVRVQVDPSPRERLAAVPDLAGQTAPGREAHVGILGQQFAGCFGKPGRAVGNDIEAFRLRREFKLARGIGDGLRAGVGGPIAEEVDAFARKAGVGNADLYANGGMAVGVEHSADHVGGGLQLKIRRSR